MTIRIKNWSKHQHFKDRTPPWIKLYREILDDPDWHDLSGDDAKLLVGLWLVASEDDSRTGALPNTRKLAFRMRISELDLNQAINRLSQWLICDDINSISERHRDDASEGEAEGETDTDSSEANASGDESPNNPPADPIWGTGLAFLMRKGIPEKPARGLLGKVKHALGDAEAARILNDAETQDVSDPAPWLLQAIAAAKARAGPGKGKPSIAQNFSAKTYTGTPDNELPDFLRAGTA